ncbi:hypothetical protein ACFRI7_05720 [Streptomyces sp. NPDC056716]|uniref:hypothetical protein n=1 Tax=unclassified Streptomyces TaxID=2593676 RepID=UPI0036763996
MKRSSRARLSATAAVGALSLALITGCSDEGSADSEGAAGSGDSGSSAAAPAKALSATELEKLLLAEGELKGFRVDPGDDSIPDSKTEVSADQAECDPLVWSTSALPPGETDAGANNLVGEDPTGGASPTGPLTEEGVDMLMEMNMTFVGLSSYEGDGAEQAMKAVNDGVRACSGGFAMTGEGETSQITEVSAYEGADQGDESAAFTMKIDMDGQGTAAFNTEVVRTGSTIATFYTVDFGSIGTGEATDIPAALVEAQIAKLK